MPNLFAPSVIVGAVALSHAYLGSYLRPGDTAVDATLGKGRDALLMARLTAPGGKVFAFDIQSRALEEADALFAVDPPEVPVTMIHASHLHMAEYVTEAPRTILFNLGYLPGGDKAVTTLWPETAAALDAATSLVERGGIVLVVVYPGHPAGLDESRGIAEFAANLDQKDFVTVHHHFPNQNGSPPELYLFGKR